MAEPGGRSWQLLKLLIERYIDQGQPVSSKVLANDSYLSVSSATIRHVMAELEKSGYVTSPHTSAGRVPTERAYRLFVDNLLTAGTTNADLSLSLAAHQNTTTLLKSTSELLSGVTRLAGIVTTPKCNEVTLQHVEFLSLGKTRVLVILVFNQNEIQNRVIQTKRIYTSAELQQAANFINENYAGKNLMTIRESLLQAMQEDRKTMHHLMQIAIDMANKAFQQKQKDEDYVLSGQTHLLDVANVSGLNRLRSLFDAFTHKQEVLHLLDRCLQAKGMQIFIGHEAGSEVFEDFSVVAAPYGTADKVLGVLGVIGPMRMPYDRVISTVNITAKLLSEALDT